MEMQQIIEQAEQNISKALEDYRAHTTQTEQLDDVKDSFIRNLAKDSAYAKQGLRELFSQSPVWDEHIDALVINGTRTHNPDFGRLADLAREILYPAMRRDDETYNNCVAAIRFFSNPDMDDYEKQQSIAAIHAIDPKAYTPTKKPSRVFKAICTALGVADESAGRDFQRLYAQFADELTAKKLGLKLYVSINPAHFLTMSNPKHDRRGNTLTSCHSFNSTEYESNNGCSGYARDEVSFIVFTVDDPRNPETLNNRKTSRQIFAYRPGSGLLMQSRMYDTAGGVYGAAEDSKLYRDLVQREISTLECVPNLWKTFSSFGDKSYYVQQGDGFGGYPDWTYDNFDGHISLRADCDAAGVAALEVGTWGLCIRCGCETSKGLYCAACRDENYTYCDDCENYHPNDCTIYIDGRDVCDDCCDEYYEECDDCKDFHRRDDMTLVHDDRGLEVFVCEDCLGNYLCCDKCDEYYPVEEMHILYRSNGEVVAVCDDCAEEYEEGPHCGELIAQRDDGSCPACGAMIETEEDAK